MAYCDKFAVPKWNSVRRESYGVRPSWHYLKPQGPGRARKRGWLRVWWCLPSLSIQRGSAMWEDDKNARRKRSRDSSRGLPTDPCRALDELLSMRRARLWTRKPRPFVSASIRRSPRWGSHRRSLVHRWWGEHVSYTSVPSEASSSIWHVVILSACGSKAEQSTTQSLTRAVRVPTPSHAENHATYS